jgi:hypothetical protein
VYPVLNVRMVVPPESVAAVLPLLTADEAVVNLVHLPDAVRKPRGDLVTCDVPREEVSRVLSLVRHLEEDGTIVLDAIDTAMGEAMDEARD